MCSGLLHEQLRNKCGRSLLVPGNGVIPLQLGLKAVHPQLHAGWLCCARCCSRRRSRFRVWIAKLLGRLHARPAAAANRLRRRREPVKQHQCMWCSQATLPTRA